MTVLFGEVVTPPAPPVLPASRGGLHHAWTGADGSEWDLSDWSTGAFLTDGGIEGLDDPPWSDFTSESPAVAGQRHLGGRDLARPVFWPIFLFSDGSSEHWVAVNRAWWRSLSRREYGTWTVTQPSGERRRLRCRRAATGGHSFTGEVSRRWAAYGVPLVADWPYWQGDPVVREFSIGDPDSRAFTDPATPEVFYISQGQTLATARIPNPGDVPAYPTWTVRGGGAGATGVVLGVGDRRIGVTGTVAAGDVLVVNTRTMTTTLNGVRVRGRLSPHEFSAVPPGASVPLNIAASGTGTITAELVPDYWWAM